jgi:hypothetical protein
MRIKKWADRAHLQPNWPAMAGGRADPIPRGRADRGAVAIARIDLRAECGRKIPIARSRAGGEVAVRGEERSVRE